MPRTADDGLKGKENPPCELVNMIASTVPLSPKEVTLACSVSRPPVPTGRGNTGKDQTPAPGAKSAKGGRRHMHPYTPAQPAKVGVTGVRKSAR